MSETDQSNGPSTSCGNESTQSNLQLTLNEMKSLEQFHILEELGEGSYSTVYLASTKKGEKRYALKICSKLKIQREKKVRFFLAKSLTRPAIILLVVQFCSKCSLVEHLFFDVSEYLVFQRIANNRYKFEDDFPDSEAKNVIREFLRPQQTERLGSPSIGGFDSIRDHAFFSSIDWNELNNSPSPLSSYYSSTK
ncbi:3-phosphoinositide-dependent protein kinase 1 [Aphelenchoides besseyi]|nr:3-phosphoinositide-dependent protein kinase 1 [Aphelenchoides besseyi]